LGYLNSIFPDAKFLLMKRNPLPNIKSLLNVGFYQGASRELWWREDGVYDSNEIKFFENNLERPEFIAALQYYKISKVHEAEVLSHKLEQRIATVSYEDFVVN